MEAPLGNLRVLDLTDIRGQLCGRLLAALGAEVVLVERPGGDPCRNLPPFLDNVPGKERSLSFWYYNAGKLGITLDAACPLGRQLLTALAGMCDVLVESCPPGGPARPGLDHTAVQRASPRLVTASITGFGQDGPWKDNRTCDLVSSALGGQMYLSGAVDTPPLKPFGLQSYHLASLYAISGILLALRQRPNTGAGGHVDISIHECVPSCLDHALVRYLHDGDVARRMGSRHWDDGFDIFPCRDGSIFLSLFQGWEALVELMDSEGKAADLKEPCWQDSLERHRHIEHIVDIVSRWTAGHSASELVELGQMMRLPWAKVATLKEAAEDPQLESRGFFSPVRHPETGSVVRFPGLPRLSGAPAPVARPPLLGEHNQRAYGGLLGLTEEELRELERVGVI